jgi:hypothetical protein
VNESLLLRRDAYSTIPADTHSPMDVHLCPLIFSLEVLTDLSTDGVGESHWPASSIPELSSPASKAIESLESSIDHDGASIDHDGALIRGTQAFWVAHCQTEDKSAARSPCGGQKSGLS